MSERLKELQRLRAHAQEQLAWFDREIAAESARVASGAVTTPVTPSPGAPIATPIPQPVSPALAPTPAAFVAPEAAASLDPATQEVIAQYQNKTQNLASDVKRGCIIYFILALAALGLGLLVLYFFTAGRK